MTEILVLQHHVADPPGAIARLLEARGATLKYVRMHEGDSVPDDMGRTRAIVSMGGPMSAHDTLAHPFLAAEMRLHLRALAAGIPILGVCLGGQLLARALGGTVRASGKKEIGWHMSSLTSEGAEDPLFQGESPTFVPFHWHGDLFALPPGAIALARSELTPVQAFRHGRTTYALQFHLEMTPKLLGAMLADGASELEGEKLDPRAIALEGETLFPPMEALATRVFSRWITEVLQIP